MSVDGTVVLDRTADVTKMGRATPRRPRTPPSAVYRLTGDIAERVQVELGRISVNEVEVVRGLTVGLDEVVLSDMTQWQDDARVRVVGR